jgi:hypothetical protein
METLIAASRGASNFDNLYLGWSSKSPLKLILDSWLSVGSLCLPLQKPIRFQVNVYGEDFALTNLIEKLPVYRLQ